MSTPETSDGVCSTGSCGADEPPRTHPPEDTSPQKGRSLQDVVRRVVRSFDQFSRTRILDYPDLHEPDDDSPASEGTSSPSPHHRP